MAFVQIIELRTSQVDEIQKLEAKWRAATEGKRTLQRAILTRDRSDPNRYLIIAFFDSYESAMENSSLPETGEFGLGQAAFLDGPSVFTDLDVISDQT
jgi:hypothetical protein